MVQQVTNLAQQNVISPFNRGEQQQQQINQRQQQEQTTVSLRDRETTQTRRSGTEASQTQNSNTQFNGGNESTALSVNEFRQQLGIEDNQRPPRGSLIDISA